MLLPVLSILMKLELIINGSDENREGKSLYKLSRININGPNPAGLSVCFP
jgi:ribosome-associated protein YbcJ (S4-like RNA binding protein)